MSGGGAGAWGGEGLPPISPAPGRAHSGAPSLSPVTHINRRTHAPPNPDDQPIPKTPAASWVPKRRGARCSGPRCAPSSASGGCAPGSAPRCPPVTRLHTAAAPAGRRSTEGFGGRPICCAGGWLRPAEEVVTAPPARPPARLCVARGGLLLQPLLGACAPVTLHPVCSRTHAVATTCTHIKQHAQLRVAFRLTVVLTAPLISSGRRRAPQPQSLHTHHCRLCQAPAARLLPVPAAQYCPSCGGQVGCNPFGCGRAAVRPCGREQGQGPRHSKHPPQLTGSP